jgi:hypothetical protein
MLYQLSYAHHGALPLRLGFYNVARRLSTSNPLFDDGSLNGAPEGIRTPGPQLRRLLLYPTELQARLNAEGEQGKLNPFFLNSIFRIPHFIGRGERI